MLTVFDEQFVQQTFKTLLSMHIKRIPLASIVMLNSVGHKKIIFHADGREKIEFIIRFTNYKKILTFMAQISQQVPSFKWDPIINVPKRKRLCLINEDSSQPLRLWLRPRRTLNTPKAEPEPTEKEEKQKMGIFRRIINSLAEFFFLKNSFRTA